MFLQLATLLEVLSRESLVEGWEGRERLGEEGRHCCG